MKRNNHGLQCRDGMNASTPLAEREGASSSGWVSVDCASQGGVAFAQHFRHSGGGNLAIPPSVTRPTVAGILEATVGIDLQSPRRAMKRKIVISSLLLQLILVAVVASLARAAVYVVNPSAENGDAWIGCLLAGAVAGSIAAGLIARTLPETNGTNLDRGISWGDFSGEISGSGDVHDHGDAGAGDGGGGDGGGGK